MRVSHSYTNMRDNIRDNIMSKGVAIAPRAMHPRTIMEVGLAKRQITEDEKRVVLAQQTESGVLYCFADHHPIAEETDVEFHHIRPFSEGGPSEIENIGGVCKVHHRRIGTLSLSEFRGRLEMDRFFSSPEPRRLDDLLQLKLGKHFGRNAIVSSPDQATIALHFPWLTIPSQSSAVFNCPATGMRYFYASLPISAIANDSELQPRPLEQGRVWELYRHLSVHTQLAPAVCRLADQRILLFDGQHKSAAQIWAGRTSLDCKVYIDPPTNMLKETNLSAHDKLRQMPFFTSTLMEKYAGIFKQEWIEFLESPGVKSEANFVAFLRAKGKTRADATKMLRLALEQDVLEAANNEVLDFLSERNRSRQNPLTASLLEKTFFKEFLLPPPAAVEFEGTSDFRRDERANLARLMSMIVEKQLVNRWNPDTEDAAHKRAERIFTAGVMRTWVPMLRNVVAQVLQLYDADERNRAMFRVIDETKWKVIEGRVDRLFSHKMWDDQSPILSSSLKVNSIEAIKAVFSEQGLTVGWILGTPA